MTAARPIRFAAAGVVLVGVLAACSQAPPPEPLRPLAESVRADLAEPVAATGGGEDPAWSELHRRLIAGEAPEAIAAEAELRLASGGGSRAGRLLLAEARLVAGEPAAALAALESAPAGPGAEAFDRVAARAHETLGDFVRAHDLYSRWSDRPGPAAAGAERTRTAAIRTLVEAIDSALARDRPREADRSLALLQRWAPESIQTLRATAAVAAALEDPARWIESLRGLDAAGALSLEERRQLAALELRTGEPDAALGLYQDLVRELPDDPELREGLDRARFRWRLANAPAAVQLVAGQPVLSRADLARLLYWIVPGVRTARGGVPRIASDIVGHPAREEVVRIVNLGLLELDEPLHRFDPDRPARRIEAIEAILRASDPACAPAGALAARSWDALCAVAVACGLVPEAGECLPGSPVSGAEALEWIRVAGREGGQP